MLKSVFRLSLFALTAWLYAASASAEASWYRVEIVVFANTEATAGREEAWPAANTEPLPANARHLGPAGSGGAYAMVPGSELKLGGVVDALRRSGSRKPLLHIGWKQPVMERGKAQPVVIEGGPRRYLADGRSAAEIVGTLLLTRSRFLHVWPELHYTTQDMGGATYTMQDHRRMRSGELHYIDHPMFGLLILCTPIQAGG